MKSYIKDMNQSIIERQINLQNEIDLLELDIVADNSSINKVYDHKAIENIFILRLEDETPSQPPMETINPMITNDLGIPSAIIRKKKMTGFDSPKCRWTPEADAALIEGAKTMTAIELAEGNSWGFTVAAIRTRLWRLGYRINKVTGLYVKVS